MMPRAETRNDAAFMVGDWLVEPSLNRVSNNGTQVHLVSKVMSVLVYLSARQGEVVSADELTTAIWDGRPMGENPVYKCIGRLRKAFDDDPHTPAYIATVPKKGYRLIAPVHALDATPGVVREQSKAPWKGLIVAGLTVIVIMAGALSLLMNDRFRPGGEGHEFAYSLAVLPFVYSDDSTPSGLSGNGIADEISNQLAEAPNLRIIAQSSASAFGSENPDLDAVMQQLDVDHVLIGSVHSRGDRMTMEVRLLDASGDEIWSDRYLAHQRELLTVLGNVVQDVAGNLGVRLDAELVGNCRGTDNLEACRLYLMAEEHIRHRGPNRREIAIELLQQAIAQEPGYAAAHAALGRAYLIREGEISWPESFERAGIAIQRAQELNQNLAEAHAARGLMQLADCPPGCAHPTGYEVAEETFHRALDLKPNLTVARNGLAIAMVGQGRAAEALEQWQAALSHDPLNPVINYNIILHLAYQGDYEEARRRIEEFQRSPNATASKYRLLARIEGYFGNFDESLKIRRELAGDAPSVTEMLELSVNYRNLGMFKEAEVLLAEHQPETLYEPYDKAYQALLIAQGRMGELEIRTRAMTRQAHAEFGPSDHWPDWVLRTLGNSHAVLGLDDAAVDYLSQVYGDTGTRVDHVLLVDELDSLHFLVHALQRLGRTEQADTVLATSLQLIERRKAQGYTGFPGLTFAEARAYALQGRKALAVATLHQAVAQGWRHYWPMSADPRWDSLRQEVDFEEVLARVRDDMELMRERITLAGASAHAAADRPLQ